MFVQSRIFNAIYTFLIASLGSGSGMLSNGMGIGDQMSVHKYMYTLGCRYGKPAIVG